jgi:FMN phosphatase YigB (HAD superfamily)
MVKAVIFDCFGVLATEAWLPFKSKHFGDDPELFAAASDIARQVNRGLISSDDFIEQVSELAGVKPTEVRRAVTGNTPNQPLFDYLRQLKPHYKLGFLSNIGGDRLNQIFTPEQLALFDAISMSFKTGYIKPDPEAYKEMAAHLQVKTNDCVFVDDVLRNVDGAKATGMAAVLYQDVAHLKKELAKLLADPEN